MLYLQAHLIFWTSPSRTLAMFVEDTAGHNWTNRAKRQSSVGDCMNRVKI